MKKPKIVVQYPFIALYRIPIFKKLFASERFDFIFWAGKESPDKYLKSAFDESGLPIEEVPLKVFRVPIINKALEFQLSAIAKLMRVRPDVYIILANPNSVTSWLCMLTARVFGVRVLAWSHGFLSDEKGFKGHIRAFFYKIPHGHLLYGNRAKDIMVRKGFDPEKIDVIYNSLDYGKQSALRNALGWDDRANLRKKLNIPVNALVLVSIGRLMSKLKIDQAIEAVKKMDQQGKNVYLLVIGDGPEKTNLVQLASLLDVADKVIFYGACHEEEVLAKLFNASDVSVVMGKVGLSAMHSLGYGIPLLTNNNMDKHFPEIEVIKEGETGWFFEENDIDDFVSKVKQIKYKDEIYEKCINAIEEHYTPEKQCQYIENAISQHFFGDNKCS